MDELNTRILEVSPLVEECYRAQTVAFSPFEYPYIRNLIETNNIRSVLDIGTGEGTFISGLAVQTPEVRYLAIDADSSLIEMAKRNHSRENITFVHALFGPSYSGDPYDMILARFTIEHVPEAVHFIAEAYDRLNPGGIMLITEYFIDDLHSTNEDWKLFRQKELEFYQRFGSHPRISLQIPAFMGLAGFTDIESSFRLISPTTAGKDNFYKVIESYVYLYGSIEPEIWTPDVMNPILKYCRQAPDELTDGEDILLISQTIGRK
jgi:ubiquinone/menaquinone biosynthesis C-methylase UbiE